MACSPGRNGHCARPLSSVVRQHGPRSPHYHCWRFRWRQCGGNSGCRPHTCLHKCAYQKESGRTLGCSNSRGNLAIRKVAPHWRSTQRSRFCSPAFRSSWYVWTGSGNALGSNVDAPQKVLSEVRSMTRYNMLSDNAFEWAVNQRGPRLAAAGPSWPAVQLNRFASQERR
jgi:hypothetical protein